MVATASSRAQFASIYPSAGSFITYITRAIAAKVTAAAGVITILGYLIAFGGIYIVAGSIAQNAFCNPHIRGLAQIIGRARGVQGPLGVAGTAKTRLPIQPADAAEVVSASGGTLNVFFVAEGTETIPAACTFNGIACG
jgi:amino acid transporter